MPFVKPDISGQEAGSIHVLKNKGNASPVRMHIIASVIIGTLIQEDASVTFSHFAEGFPKNVLL